MHLCYWFFDIIQVMKRVAKLLLRDGDGNYLLLYRSDHPSFPGDADLPGGTLEDNEEPARALIRELSEETGIALRQQTLEKLYESDAYDKDYLYYLYNVTLNNRPKVSISWEHSSYEWLPFADFIARAHTAKDKYMHMVYECLSQNYNLESKSSK